MNDSEQGLPVQEKVELVHWIRSPQPPSHDHYHDLSCLEPGCESGGGAHVCMNLHLREQ